MKRKYYMRGMGVGVLITVLLCAVALPEGKESMTDEQVIARAKELGYEKRESGVTADDINKIKDHGKTTATSAATTAPETTEEATPEGTPGPTVSPIPTPDAPNPPDEPEQPTMPIPKEEQPTETVTPKPTATKAPTKAPTATTVPTKEPVATAEPRSTQTPTEPPKATVSPELTDIPVSDYCTITVERGMTARRVAERLVSIGAITDAEEFVQYLIHQKLTDYINIGTFNIPQGASYAEIAKLLTQ